MLKAGTTPLVRGRQSEERGIGLGAELDLPGGSATELVSSQYVCPVDARGQQNEREQIQRLLCKTL